MRSRQAVVRDVRMRVRVRLVLPGGGGVSVPCWSMTVLCYLVVFLAWRAGILFDPIWPLFAFYFLLGTFYLAMHFLGYRMHS